MKKTGQTNNQMERGKPMQPHEIKRSELPTP